MTVIRFEHGSLSEIRFGASAIVDVSCAARLAYDPEARPGVLAPWWHAARAAIGRVRLPMVEALHRPDAYVPDFLVARPDHRPSLLRDLQALAETDPAEIRRGLTFAHGDRLPAALRPLHESPTRGAVRLARELAAFARLTLGGPRWTALRTLSAAEAWQRGQLLASAGPRAALEEPIPGLRLEQDALVVADGLDAEVRPTVEGFWLVPSPFAPERPRVTLDPAAHGGLAYVPPGVAQAIHAGEGRDPLVVLTGRTRARLLRALLAPASTAELATALGLAPSTVSEHLGRLDDAGLVVSERHGRIVSYALAARGRKLLEALDG